MSTARRSTAALFAVMMLFVAGACSSSGSDAKKTSSDTFSSDTGSSSDTASTDDTSFTDSGFSDSGFSDSGFSDSSSSSDDTVSFCLAVEDIKQATKDLNAANSANDDTAYKAGIQKAATAFQDLATYAPPSQQADAQFIASFWSDFNDAVQATSPGDPARGRPARRSTRSATAPRSRASTPTSTRPAEPFSAGPVGSEGDGGQHGPPSPSAGPVPADQPTYTLRSMSSLPSWVFSASVFNKYPRMAAAIAPLMHTVTGITTTSTNTMTTAPPMATSWRA